MLKKIMYVLLMLLILQGLIFAGSKKISYQGKLNDSSGNPIDTAGSPITVTFRLYDALEGGSEVWAQNQGVEFENGLFNVTFEDAGLDNLAFDKQYYISIQIAGDNEMSPRQAISASGYALGSLGNFDINGTLKVNGLVGIGTANPSATMDVNGSLLTKYLKVNTGDNGSGEQYFNVTSYWDGVIRMNPGKQSTIFMNREVGKHRNFHILDGYTYPVLTAIGASGNIGLGTWSPQRLLELHGNIEGELGIRIDNDGASSSAEGSYWDIYEKGGANGSLNIKHGGSNYPFMGFFIRRADNQPIFGIQGSNLRSYSLFIGGNGNVGVGTSTPGATLDINGNFFTKGLRVKTSDNGSGEQYFDVTSYQDGIVRVNPGKQSTIFMNREVGAYKNFYVLDGYMKPLLTVAGQASKILMNGKLFVEKDALAWHQYGDSAAIIKHPSTTYLNDRAIIDFHNGYGSVAHVKATGKIYAKGFITQSPNIREETGIKNPTAKDYLKWALKDAKKPIAPYKIFPSINKKKQIKMNKVKNNDGTEKIECIEEEVELEGEGYFNTKEEVEREDEKYSKDISKIAIGVANWAEDADNNIENLKQQIEFLKNEIALLKKRKK
ncbi:hypothetical protein ACFL4O_03055 [bacterium]